MKNEQMLIGGMTATQFRHYLKRAVRDMKAIDSKMDKAYMGRIKERENNLELLFLKMNNQGLKETIIVPLLPAPPLALPEPNCTLVPLATSA